MAQSANPILVEATRGGIVESWHRGAVAVVDAAGTVVRAWGDIDRPVFPRSALKPVQALALVESGAVERFGLNDTHLALACASHNGETVHTLAVAAWLALMGLGEADLACGPQEPEPQTWHAMVQGHAACGRLHNNCSGKHAGFLAAALAWGEPVAGYAAPEHRVQAHALERTAEFAGVARSSLVLGVDGCSAPNPALPLVALARVMARLAVAEAATPAGRVMRAMRAHPYLVAGRDRFCTDVMPALEAGAVVKTGAEGVFVATLPGRGWGIAVKIDDGATRASQAALLALLHGLGAVTGPCPVPLAVPIVSRMGEFAGEVRPVAGWPA
ncbi:asparaginase [Zavarzinia sp. CC-PAN008]|uniref:asparaginase n=1 Tax=Zavarzinia sp. CC-PAN008 TaxID=3243332 RepID=UPI003F74A402